MVVVVVDEVVVVVVVVDVVLVMVVVLVEVVVAVVEVFVVFVVLVVSGAPVEQARPLLPIVLLVDFGAAVFPRLLLSVLPVSNCCGCPVAQPQISRRL